MEDNINNNCPNTDTSEEKSNAEIENILEHMMFIFPFAMIIIAFVMGYIYIK